MADFCGRWEPVLLGIPVAVEDMPGTLSFDGNMLSFPTIPALGADNLDLGLLWALSSSGDGALVGWETNKCLLYDVAVSQWHNSMS